MSTINYELGKVRGIVFDVDGVLSPATVTIGPDGVPRRMANLRDGYAMVQAVKSGLWLAIISGGDEESVRKRFEIIGVQDIYLGAGDKLPLLHEWMGRRGLRAEEVIYVGDDVPDVAPMRAAGLAVAPCDATPDAYMAAGHITRAAGGYGVAREIIEEIMRDRGTWPGTSASAGQ